MNKKQELVARLQNLLLSAGRQQGEETDKFRKGFWIDAEASIERCIQEITYHPAY